ncbi:MAG: hypothetical protein ABSC94_08775 [Polyangiaceae bacterium]|jgi:uncharacterized protein involved in exopolysaccharide biosynthesis
MAGEDFDAVPAESAQQDGEFDFQQVKELVGFAARSPRRHPILTTLVFVTCAGLAIAVAALWPRTYETGVRLLAQRNLTIQAVENAQPRDNEDLSQHTADMIRRRENLMSLAKELNLLQRWDETRPPLLRLKDRVLALVGPKVTEQERVLGLVQYLETKIKVDADQNGLTIAVQWPSALMSYEIVNTIERNFIDARYDVDVAMLNDAIGILQQHANEENDRIVKAMGELEKALDEQKAQLAALPSAAASASAAPDDSAAHVQVPSSAARAAAAAAAASMDATMKAFAEKRAEVNQAEENHQRQLAELTRKLEEAVVTQGLGPAHPTVVALNQAISQAKKEPPQLEELRLEERSLANRLSEPAPVIPGLVGVPAAAPTSHNLQGSAGITVQIDRTDTPAVSLARTKLTDATTKYTEDETRIDQAQIQLDLSKAQAKYRFSVMAPAEIPKKPKKPNVPLVLVVGFLGAILFSLGSAFAKDLLGGRLLEPWQVQRRLKLPLLGEFDQPSS